MAKAGKYDAVLPGLPKLQPEDAGHQAKVNAVKQTVTDRDAFSMAERYADLRRGRGPELSPFEAGQLIERLGKDGLKALSSRCEVLVKAYEQLLADSKEARAEGWGLFGVKENAIRLPSGETIRIHEEPYGKVVDKEAFRQWCIASGYERDLQMWPSKMNAIVKERLVAGEPGPEGTEAFSYVEVQFVKKGAE